MRTTLESHAAALEYLRSRGALDKLNSETPALFENSRHAEALRRRRDERLAHRPRKSSRLAAWCIPFSLLNFFR